MRLTFPRPAGWRILAAALALIILGFAGWSPAAAQTLPAGFSRVTITAGITSPTAMAFAPDGRIFVAEQLGALRVIDSGGSLLPAPFVTVNTTPAIEGERGLLGVAFHPDFANNRYVYVYYTLNSVPRRNRVSRFQADAVDPNIAAGPEEVIFELQDLGSMFHNGGAIHFGPDGMLYIAAGDNRIDLNAQDLTNLHGKILRLTPLGAIPPDNPFISHPDPNVRREIWAYGLRNPFTFAFDPASGALYANDVGEQDWEEVNHITPGGNYGWPHREGFLANPNFPAPPGFTSISPLTAYDHNTGGNACSIAGGAFYNPPVHAYPAAYAGDYFYGDFCGGWIYHYDHATGTSAPFASNLGLGVVDVRVSTQGEVLYLTRGAGGNVFRIAYDGPPEIIQDPVSVTAAEGQAVSFNCQGTGTPPLTYQWQRNGADIPAATSPAYTFTAASADLNASFRCVVSNAFGSAASAGALLNALNPNITVFDPGLSKIGLLPAGGIGLPGEQVTWVTTVSNDGGAAGNNIVLVDVLRPELRIDSATTDRGTVNINGQTVTVVIPTLAPGERVEFRIVTTILSSPVSGILENTVSIAGSGVSASANVPVVRVTSLPATGQTPWWRMWVLGAVAGLTVLAAASLIVAGRGGATVRRSGPGS